MEKNLSDTLKDILGISNIDDDKIGIELSTKSSFGNENYLEDWLNDIKNGKKIDDIDSRAFYQWLSPKNKERKKYDTGDIALCFFALDNKAKDKWLFITGGRITNEFSTEYEDMAEYEILDNLKPYFGRLIINCPRINERSYYYHFDTVKISEITILEDVYTRDINSIEDSNL